MRFRSMLLAFALTAAAGTVNATEIYRWVDEDGIVHYVDLPTGAPGEEHLAIRSRPTDPARVEASVRARQEARAARAEEQETNVTQGPGEAERLAAAGEREENCNKYRERQMQFTINRRIYRMDENGERVYYSDEEMQAARDKVDERVSYYCS